MPLTFHTGAAVVTSITFFYAAFALLGGVIGARLVQARMSAGVYSAGAGFLASVATQLNGGSEGAAFVVFLVAASLMGLIFKLRPIQIAAILVAVILVSIAGGFLMSFAVGFERGFDDAFLKALNHSVKP